MSAVIITEDNFEQEVAHSSIPVLLDFWASGFSGSRSAKIADNISNGLSGKMKVGKVNIHDEPDLAYKFKVRSIPTMLVIKNGKVTDTIVGGLDETQVLSILT